MPALISPERQRAKELGLKRYFTGKPCINGHIAERVTKHKTCTECERERMRTRQGHHRPKTEKSKGNAKRAIRWSDFIAPPTRAQLMAGR